MISACPQKGLGILLSLVGKFRHLKFTVVATSWTEEDIRTYLQLVGVKVVRAIKDLDQLYGRARVLLVPSILPEVYGLVAMEAALCGVPCISSDSGGLPEANVMHELVVRTRVFFDVVEQKIIEGTTVKEAEVAGDGIVEMRRRVERPWEDSEHIQATNKLMEGMAAALKVSPERARSILYHAPEDIVEPYAALLQRLTEDESYLRWASQEAHCRARTFVLSRQNAFVELLRSAD